MEAPEVLEKKGHPQVSFFIGAVPTQSLSSERELNGESTSWV